MPRSEQPRSSGFLWDPACSKISLVLCSRAHSDARTKPCTTSGMRTHHRCPGLDHCTQRGWEDVSLLLVHPLVHPAACVQLCCRMSGAETRQLPSIPCPVQPHCTSSLARSDSPRPAPTLPPPPGALSTLFAQLQLRDAGEGAGEGELPGRERGVWAGAAWTTQAPCRPRPHGVGHARVTAGLPETQRRNSLTCPSEETKADTPAPGTRRQIEAGGAGNGLGDGSDRAADWETTWRLGSERDETTQDDHDALTPC